MTTTAFLIGAGVAMFVVSLVPAIVELLRAVADDE
jgi:hypothetical protein